MESGEKLCSVCSTEDSKYRCPKCRSFYCSLVCSKAHKSSGKCAPSEEAARRPKDGTKEQKQEQERSDLQSDVSVPVLLSESQKKELRRHPGVKTAVRSRRLRAQLRAIHCASDRQGALKRARLIPEFEDFVESLLEAVATKAPV